jgi:hypothetical protein
VDGGVARRDDAAHLADVHAQEIDGAPDQQAPLQGVLNSSPIDGRGAQRG